MTEMASAFDRLNDSLSTEPIFKWEKVRVAIQSNLNEFPKPWELTDEDDPIVVRAQWGKFWNLNTSSNPRARGLDVEFKPNGFSFKLAPADLVPNTWDIVDPEFYTIRAVLEGLGNRVSLVVSGMYPNDGSVTDIRYRQSKVLKQTHKITYQALSQLAWDDKDVTIERMVEHGIIPELLPNHEYQLILDINPDDSDLDFPNGTIVYCHKMTQGLKNALKDSQVRPIQRMPQRTQEPATEKLPFSMVSLGWCYMDKAFPDMEHERAMTSIIGSYLSYSNEREHEHWVEPVEVQDNTDKSTLEAMNQVFG